MSDNINPIDNTESNLLNEHSELSEKDILCFNGDDVTIYNLSGDDLIGKELTGEQFNRIYKNIKLFKFLNNDLTHYRCTYGVGLNIDVLDFNSTAECLSGGLYFCEESKCYMFALIYGQKLAHIEIPDDARVYVEKDKFKADKIIIKEIVDFKDVLDDFWINMLHQNGLILQLIKKQTDDVCTLAVKQNGYALKYVKKQVDDICEFAVRQNGRALQFVLKQTPMICKLAVTQNGLVLEYVKDQTLDICILAVNQNSLALQFVKTLDEKLCIRAVRENGWAIQYVPESSEFLTEELCALAVSQNGRSLCYVKNQTPQLCELAVQENPLALEFVKEQTSHLCELAVRQNNSALEFVKDLSCLPKELVAEHVNNRMAEELTKALDKVTAQYGLIDSLERAFQSLGLELFGDGEDENPENGPDTDQ